MPLQNRNSTGFPTPATKEGEPIETRLPEKVDNKPVFAGQTRAPHRASVPDNVATSTDKLKTPFSFAFLPEARFREKGGTLRIRDEDGTLSPPIAGVPTVLAIAIWT
jgi:hypothetical protein